MLGKDRAVPRAALPGAELSTTTATAPVEVTNHEYLRKAATGAGQHKRTSDRSVKGEYLDIVIRQSHACACPYAEATPGTLAARGILHEAARASGVTSAKDRVVVLSWGTDTYRVSVQQDIPFYVGSW
jgi:hypothetical protein